MRLGTVASILKGNFEIASLVGRSIPYATSLIGTHGIQNSFILPSEVYLIDTVPTSSNIPASKVLNNALVILTGAAAHITSDNVNLLFSNANGIILAPFESDNIYLSSNPKKPTWIIDINSNPQLLKLLEEFNVLKNYKNIHQYSKYSKKLIGSEWKLVGIKPDNLSEEEKKWPIEQNFTISNPLSLEFSLSSNINTFSLSKAGLRWAVQKEQIKTVNKLGVIELTYGEEPELLFAVELGKSPEILSNDYGTTIALVLELFNTIGRAGNNNFKVIFTTAGGVTNSCYQSSNCSSVVKPLSSIVKALETDSHINTLKQVVILNLSELVADLNEIVIKSVDRDGEIISDVETMKDDIAKENYILKKRTRSVYSYSQENEIDVEKPNVTKIKKSTINNICLSTITKNLIAHGIKANSNLIDNSSSYIINLRDIAKKFNLSVVSISSGRMDNQGLLSLGRALADTFTDSIYHDYIDAISLIRHKELLAAKTMYTSSSTFDHPAIAYVQQACTGISVDFDIKNKITEKLESQNVIDLWLKSKYILFFEHAIINKNIKDMVLFLSICQEKINEIYMKYYNIIDDKVDLTKKLTSMKKKLKQNENLYLQGDEHVCYNNITPIREVDISSWKLKVKQFKPVFTEQNYTTSKKLHYYSKTVLLEYQNTGYVTSLGLLAFLALGSILYLVGSDKYEKIDSKPKGEIVQLLTGKNLNSIDLPNLGKHISSKQKAKYMAQAMKMQGEKSRERKVVPEFSPVTKTSNWLE